MEDSVDGLALPTFSGRLSADWSSHEARLTSWLSIRGIPLHAREAAETLELSLTAQAALSFEQEAGLAERRVWDEAVAWCRERWGGERRKRLAAAAAVNRLNARSFRERGSRRENVKDLISELDLLFLQAGVVDDEAQRRVLVGCFFEFPRALHRLSRTSSYADACVKALEWEGEMVRKERENLTSHLQSRPPAPPSRQDLGHDPSASTGHWLDRPTNPTPGGSSSPLVARRDDPSPSPHADVHFRPDDLLDATNALVADTNAAGGWVAERRSSLDLPRHELERATEEEFYPARSVETLHAYTSTSSATRRQPGEERRTRSSLAAYPSPDSLPARNLPSLYQDHSSVAYRSSCAVNRQRSALPSFNTPLSSTFSRQNGRLEPPATPTESLRIHTPPFVTEATSISTSENGGEDLLASFPYPSRPSPTHPSFALSPHHNPASTSAYVTQPISASTSSAWAKHLSERRNGSLRGRPPLSPSAAHAEGNGGGADGRRREVVLREEDRGGEEGVRRKGTLLGALFGKKLGGFGHGRRRSIDWAFSVDRRAGESEEGAREMEGKEDWRLMGVGSVGRASGRGLAQVGGEGRPPKKRGGLIGGGGVPP
ncbi:hypothetical protein JCM11251_000502 [Rhodosporidiobolus azoricus]